MQPDSGSPSLLRRLAARLARLGLDPRPLFQRARNLLLRPVRHELQDARAEIAGLRAELAAQGKQLATLRAGTQNSDAALDRRRLAKLERLLAAGPWLPGSGEPAPLVSIVLPTRNRAAFVGDAIASVLAQQYANWELIVVDDGSSDDTGAVLGHFDDPRIRRERIAHRGPCGARNHGLALARGQLIAYIDSDNLWYPGFLSAAVAALGADASTALVYGALASEAHQPGELCLVLEEFDRTRLETANFIDLNTVLHRRGLYEALGGFDESLERAVDWELLLRYTAGHEARALPVLAARYRVCDGLRITDTVPIGPSWIAIRKRIDPVPVPPRPPRILYVAWHYPQLCESYLETELRCLRRWGAEIEIWREGLPASPYPASIPIHDGALEEAVRRFRPDAIHVHWLGIALNHGAALGALGVPVTLRMHGFDVGLESFQALLAKPWLHRVYAFPVQLRLLPGPDPRALAVPAAFDTRLFPPAMSKDPRLVLRTGAALPSKDIGLFFALAKRMPGFRFVFVGATCNEVEYFPQQLRDLRAEMDSPVELHFDMPREQVSALVAEAGIYLHTVTPPEAPFGTPIGMPISIAESMATGAYVLVLNQPALVEYIGDAGAVYADIDEAARLIEATTAWDERRWRSQRVRASDRAFLNHADELTLRPIFEDWCELARRRRADVLDPAGVAGAV